ncbi:hypothetical protein [Polaromonas sp. SM01]|uniref:hypothetical protein n=1 Tax=Polaromonas sp. SM01 TaxID=3085630 RepID=UPI0029824BDC|nr:hypothetical protein [Polaromonas sp. SM01]MDW5443436.1 hypothetical protein [Polaromonas sp. SM01]
MRQAIRRLFGLKNEGGTDTRSHAAHQAGRGSPAGHRDSQHTIEEHSDNGTRRQLVQMLLRDGLRQHGIPPGWVEYRMLLVNSRSRGSGMYLNLIMRRWDQRLLTYAHAFQEQLKSAITQFEPNAATWLHGISWELEVGSTCPAPYHDMPDPALWLEADVPTIASAPVPAPVVVAAVAPVVAVAAVAAGNDSDAEVLLDLQRMFAIRDADIEQQTAAGIPPVDFQDTEPARPMFQDTEPFRRP